MLLDALRLVSDAWGAGIKPDPMLTLSEWADQYRMLSQKASAEPGRWRTERTPYLKEIMDCLSPRSRVERVVFMKGAQIGGSECGNNWVGYIIDHSPGPTMVVQPTLDLAKAYSKQRIKTLIEETPRIAGKVKDAKERDSSNTMLMKEFQGGFLKVAGANSAASLRSMPVRFLFLDEIDAYPGDVEEEGDPVKLAEKRTGTFARRKQFYNSTPTVDGRSRIQSLYDQTDRRRYWVPCPHCKKFQTLKWAQIKYDTVHRGKELESSNVRYICEHCEGEIHEQHKTEMLAKGEWRAEDPGARGGIHVGFHLSALYSPVGWYSWAKAAQDFIDAKDKPEELKGFINTCLGETWKDKTDAPEWERVYERREPYPQNRAPKQVLFLTAGVDVQKDRIELEIVGWGRDKQSWSIDYRVIEGDTGMEDTWRQLDKALMETWPHESGVQMHLRMLAIDSGYNTQHVYNWARKHSRERVMAVKGVATASLMLGSPSTVDVTQRGRKVKRGFRVWPAGVSIAKSELYSWLKLKRPIEDQPFPAGYCHFPEYGPEFFKQLTAEQQVVKVVKGYRRYEWQKTQDRNEALDCRVYARIAAAAIGLDRFSPEQLEAIATEIGITIDAPVQTKAPNETPPEEPPKRDDQSRRGLHRKSFWNR